ncbi:MAG: macro domain-containing protein [Clostridiales bacterium]|nr:macro domain-containing protein [Clostridiales bacterium]
MISFTTGDLLKSTAYVLVNTVNCEGYMGKGLAYQFKIKYPKMNKDYVKACRSHELVPGKLHCYRTEDKLIINFPTKDKWIEVDSQIAELETELANLKTAQSAIVTEYGNNHVGYVYYLLKSGGSYKVRRYSPGTGGSVVVSNGTIGAYASGTKYNPVAGNYLVDEEGAELIAHNNSGRITSLEVGDRVFNSGETANLADNLEAMASSEWTNLEDTDFYKNYIDGIVSGLPYTTPVFNTPSVSDIVPSYGDSAETKDSVVVYNCTVEDITLPNVQHADELYSEIMNMAKKDNKFTKLIQTVTASGLDSRKNSKAKNNIQF